jgi:hypothetical protein
MDGGGGMTRLEKRTPKGTLKVTAYDDPNYPGFMLYLDGQQVAVFEYNSGKDALELHVWMHDLAVSVTVERSE